MCASFPKKDYYAILEINPNSTHGDIKRAYRQKVRLYHPDKNNDVFTCTIYDINEAYEILGDTTRRKDYDLERKIIASPESLMVSHLVHILHMFMIMIIDNMIHSATTTTEKDTTPIVSTHPCIQLTINVTLEDLYMKRIKKLVLNRFRNGSSEKKVLYLSLYNYDNEYCFENQGDEISAGVYGNVIVSLSILEHKLFSVDVIDKYDIWTEVDTSLYEFYYGKTVQLKYLDGTEKTLSFDGFKDQNDMVKQVKGMGLPFYDEDEDLEMHGDLYIRFILKIKPISQENLQRNDVVTVLTEFL